MKTLVITGGSSGIGKATAELFAQKGWQVFSLSRHSANMEGVRHIPCDVTSEDSVKKAMTLLLTQTEQIDVAISNAGFGISGPIEFTKTEDARRQMDVNFMGAFHFAKVVLPVMRKQGRGTIIFTSSVAAVLSVPYQAFYSASKAAINAMALAMANEVREFGIKVSCLMPGDVSTGFTDARDKSEKGADVYTHMQKAVASMEKDEVGGMQPIEMARIFWRIANKKNPAPLYVGGGMYKVFCFLDHILPKRLVNWIEGIMY